ncbi:VanZ family protein [Corallincola luteus]|uniref:VanZ family protein n=1 Tax=Corallincola luteus TaxID=1775177 RepID=UPI001F10D651|nr:VanZ family protein [Corallincola luteus]
MALLKSLLQNRWIYIVTLVICVIVISVLAFNDPPKQASMPNDKISHYLAFFALALLISHGLLLKIRYQLVLLGSYGLLIEWVQSYLPYRTASIADFAADMAGALTYYLIAAIISLIYRHFFQQESNHAS